MYSTFVGPIIDLVRFGIPAGYGIYVFIYFINLLVLLCALRGQRLGFYHYCWLTIVVPKLAQHKDFCRAEEGARLGDPRGGLKGPVSGRGYLKWELKEGALRAVGTKQVNHP